MVGDHNTHSEDGADSTTEPTPSRRTILKSSSAAAVAGAGVGLGTGTAAADEYEEEEDEDKWGDLQCLADGVEEDDIWGPFECLDFADPPTAQGVINLDPPWWCSCSYRHENWSLSDVPEDGELTVYIHGYGAKKDVQDQTYALKEALGDDYDGIVVGAKWPSITAPFTPAWDNAREYGRKLGDWVVDMVDEHRPDISVNFVGHSLGGRAAFNALDRLDERNGSVNQVITVGPADNVDFVTRHDRDHSDDCWHSSWDDRNERYYDGIANASNETYIFHSDNDWTVGCLYERWASDMLCYTPDGEGLGNPVYSDIDDSLGPANLKTEDVSHTVENHCAYFKAGGAGDLIRQKL